jgi:hypothetical protein
MPTFSGQPAHSEELTEAEFGPIAPDDPSIVEADELPEEVQVPEGVAEADYLEQILPA